MLRHHYVYDGFRVSNKNLSDVRAGRVPKRGVQDARVTTLACTLLPCSAEIEHATFLFVLLSFAFPLLGIAELRRALLGVAAAASSGQD